jgi:hypothetical protein
MRMAFSALAVWSLMVPANAADQDDVKARFGVAQQRNAEQLKFYEWSCRTELLVDGKTAGIRTDKVRYAAAGRLQRTPIPTKAEPVNSKRSDDVKGLVQRLSKFAQSYANLSDSQREAAMRAVQVKSGEAEVPGTVQLAAQNVVAPGDVLAIWADASTLLFRRVQIYTTFEKNSVQISVQYEQLEDGPAVPALIEVSYPAKKIEARITNSEFMPVWPPPSPAITGTAGRFGSENAPAQAADIDPGWPRQFTNDGGTLLTFQPQVDEWKDFKEIRWRMALTITPAGKKEVIGAASMRGLTDVDNEKRLVTLHDITLERANFPSLDAAESANMQQLLGKFLPQEVTVSLDRIAACTPKPDTFKTVTMNNDPPVILVAYKPTVLVDVDGDPVYVPVKNTALEYVLNTAWPLFRAKEDSRHYVLVGELWMTAPKLEGPWSQATALPTDMTAMLQDDHWSQLKQFIPLKPAKPGSVAPEIRFSAKPAEVILFEGTPAYTPIPGTQLSYATNTANIVFQYAKTQVYFLTAGRWFSAASLDGPWTFASASLPEDFAKIPRDSQASQVLASVPGTEEAKDAVLMAQIPTRAVVDPAAAAAKAKVVYDGEPKFSPIEGSSVSYAVNTSEKVLKVGDAYYLCLDGVWFDASGPNGPWETAKSVPDEIYKIPPSSPVYNVTYVQQTTTPDGSIEASYTAGYTGTMVMGTSVGFSVVYSTGYYYPPYIGYYAGWAYPYYPYYYARPYAYGAAGYYNSATGAYGFSQTVWGPYGSATRAARYNPYTGTYARAGSVATPYGRASAGSAYNPYTGAGAVTRQGSNAYSQWGSSVVSKGGRSAYTQHYSDARGSVGAIQGSGGGAAIGGSRNGGSSGFVGKTRNGDMYAGRDGNVYRNSGNGWQKFDNGGWNSANRPSPQSGSSGRASAPQAVQNDFQNRQRSSYSANRSSSMSSGGFSRGGGFRGGGRRR